jgi:hypothetical protein
VTDLLGRDVHDEVLVLALDAAVPALHQVLHRHGHLAVCTAEQLLELLGVHRVWLLGLHVELHVIGMSEHLLLQSKARVTTTTHYPSGCRENTKHRKVLTLNIFSLCG